MLFLRIILFPLSIVYGIVVICRNFLYNSGIYGTTEFDIPIICIGNLSYGGTGKTPHAEYIIRLLSPTNKIALLSRGYRRKTNGYLFANELSDATQIGDEPLQVKSKFPELAVAVSENRVMGVPNLLADAPDTQVIIMDDGFQHRAIKAGLNVILTDYSRLFTRDWIAPSGMLREFRSGYKRADAIIVTKCPQTLSVDERLVLEKEINPIPGQKLFFTYQHYDVLKPLYNDQIIDYKNADVLLFAGIVNTYPLEEYLATKFKSVKALRFADHKEYSEPVAELIIQEFNQIDSSNKIIITTEKDAVKLRDEKFRKIFEGIQIFYQPLTINFINNQENTFNQFIFEYVNRASQ